MAPNPVKLDFCDRYTYGLVVGCFLRVVTMVLIYRYGLTCQSVVVKHERVQLAESSQFLRDGSCNHTKTNPIAYRSHHTFTPQM